MALTSVLLPATAGAQSISDGSCAASPSDPFGVFSSIFGPDLLGPNLFAPPAAPPVSCSPGPHAALWSEPSLSAAQADELRAEAHSSPDRARDAEADLLLSLKPVRAPGVPAEVDPALVDKQRTAQRRLDRAQAAYDAALSEERLLHNVLTGDADTPAGRKDLEDARAKAGADVTAAARELATASAEADAANRALDEARNASAGHLESDPAVAARRAAAREAALQDAKTPDARAAAYASLVQEQQQLQSVISSPSPDADVSVLQSLGDCAPGISIPSAADDVQNAAALQGTVSAMNDAATSALTQLAREANPTWAGDHARGAAPTSEMLARTREGLLSGKSFDEVRRREDAAYRQSPGVAQKHAGEIDGVVAQALRALHRGRPSTAVRDRAREAAMRAWKDGADRAEIVRAAQDAWPERANERRAAWYLQQPTGWQCAPTSLTMAEAAWRVAPSNGATLARLTRELNDTPSTGLPGNASLVAAQAERDGLHARFDETRDVSAIRRALQEGHTVVINGSLDPAIGHFIYIGGIRPDGSFIVGDPFRPWITRWNDADLSQFTHNGDASVPYGFAEIWK